ncbi:protein kinase domain-containing protein [Tundrisphaera sp. TA3]|uniref:protein kinase domain-containing protein n=1 Tax=Tundrisphaera sp. TA3 TaxID=3435775 RepID=UPI003EBC86ED
MTGRESSDPTARLDLSTLRQVVSICDDFEASWHAGRRPSIEQILADATPERRPALLRALLSVEIELRRSANESPDPETYRARFPGHEDLVLAAFGEAATDPGEPSDSTTRDLPRGGETSTVLGSDPGDRDPGPGHASGRRRFRVLRQHARGGLGVIYLAQDAELDRQVALKEIQADRADDPISRGYFVREALITGGLEHPGIISVHGFGRYSDGRPFYAMRFIEGPTFEEAIDDHHRAAGSARPGANALAFRGLLRHFVDVCNAVAFAHSRGVIHRDIKPRNIKLGPFGETILLDWGLAKRVDGGASPDPAGPAWPHPAWGDEVEATADGDLRGTPAFMSPEQAAGDVEAIGRPSDIYGLGATFYYLLTGRVPTSGKKAEAIAIVREGRFPPPRQVRPGVDPALESICLKAMALRPEGRYGSALALGEDVERWLADEPVSAHPESMLVRAGRWLRHHRTAAAVAVALLMATSATALVAAALIDREKRRAEMANGLLIAAKRQADAARGSAQSERSKADASLKLAIAAIGDDGPDGGLLRMVAAADLPKLPGTEAMRLRIAGKASDLLRKLLDQQGEDPAVRFGLAKSYRELGNLFRLTGREEAAPIYATAIKLLDGLVARYPGEPRLLTYLAETCLDGAERHRMAGAFDEAGPLYRRSREAAERLVAAHPGVQGHRRTLARALYNGAAYRRDIGDHAGAIRDGEKAVVLLTALADGAKPGRTDPMELAMTLEELGSALRAAGRPTDAERALTEAIRRADALLAQAPQDRDLLYTRAVAHLELGRARAGSGHLEAVANLDEAVDQLARLAADSRDIVHYQGRWAEALLARSRSRADGGRTEEARADAERAREVVGPLLAKAERHPVHSGLMGRILGQLGRLAIARDASDEARSLLAQAAALQAIALGANPASPADRLALAEHREALARLPGPR